MIQKPFSTTQQLFSQMTHNLNVVWVHDTAELVGGCETYICNTQRLLKNFGVNSTLLYEEKEHRVPDMLKHFRNAFPIVELESQLRKIRPDLIFAHRIADKKSIEVLVNSGIPVLRFFHDHKLFCPREHKYTLFGNRTCTKSVGLQCYSCMGGFVRKKGWPGLAVRTVRHLKTLQRAHQNMAGFVVASSYMQQQLVAHGFDSRKIHCLPLYVTTPRRVPKCKRPDSQFLFVGQLVRGKGVDTLLHALAWTNDSFCLSIVGTGPQEQEIRQLSRRLGLQKRVRFFGKIEKDELAILYGNSTALVVPSRSPETFGLVGLEAMSFGLPVIASDVGGIREWLIPEQTGILCEPNCSRSLASAMKRISMDRKLGRRMAIHSKRTCQERFSPSRHTNGLAKLFSETVTKGNKQ